MESFFIRREVKKMAVVRLKEFAKKIINMASEEKLTVSELYSVVDAVKLMAGNSLVDKEINDPYSDRTKE